MSVAADDEPSLFTLVGGLGFFERVVDRFYDGVEDDAVLIPLYPEGSATAGARRRLALFLGQYWGGPDTYSTERGHPRLRMRHAPYSIGELERDRWLVHMIAAIEAETSGPDCGIAPDVSDSVRSRFVDYVVMAADHLRNAD